jgi:hypothetical protein
MTARLDESLSHSGRPGRGRRIVPALLAALLAGCAGGGGISVGTGLDDAATDDDLLLALADQVAQATVGDDPLAELAVVETAAFSAAPDPTAAPGIAAGEPVESSRTLDRNVTARYSGGRVAALRQREAAARGPVAASDLMIELHYGSSPTSADDLDQTPPPVLGGPEAFVTARIVGDWVLRSPDGREHDGGAAWGAATTYSGAATRYSDWAWALTAPTGVEAPFAYQLRWGRWGVDGPNVGASGRRIRGLDGRSDEVATRVAREAAGLALEYRRGFPDGTTAVGVGRITEPGRCPVLARAEASWTVVPADPRRPMRTVSLRSDGRGGNERAETTTLAGQPPRTRTSTRTLQSGDPCAAGEIVSWAYTFQADDGPVRHMTETRSGMLRELSGAAQGDGEPALSWQATVRPEGVDITAVADRDGQLRQLQMRLGPTGAGSGELRDDSGAAAAVSRRAEGGIEPAGE